MVNYYSRGCWWLIKCWETQHRLFSLPQGDFNPHPSAAEVTLPKLIVSVYVYTLCPGPPGGPGGPACPMGPLGPMSPSGPFSPTCPTAPFLPWDPGLPGEPGGPRSPYSELVIEKERETWLIKNLQDYN